MAVTTPAQSDLFTTGLVHGSMFTPDGAKAKNREHAVVLVGSFIRRQAMVVSTPHWIATRGGSRVSLICEQQEPWAASG
jgi:hypothetical protein